MEESTLRWPTDKEREEIQEVWQSRSDISKRHGIPWDEDEMQNEMKMALYHNAAGAMRPSAMSFESRSHEDA